MKETVSCFIQVRLWGTTSPEVSQRKLSIITKSVAGMSIIWNLLVWADTYLRVLHWTDISALTDCSASLMDASGDILFDRKFVFFVYAYRYVCLGGSSSPTPSDGSHGYPCPAGYSCPVGSASEVPCEPGTYSPAPRAAHCMVCLKGTMCPSSTTQEPATCPTGEEGENNLEPTIQVQWFNPLV